MHVPCRQDDVPPFVLIGLDHAGAQRSYEYTPYKPGVGPGKGYGVLHHHNV